MAIIIFFSSLPFFCFFRLFKGGETYWEKIKDIVCENLERDDEESALSEVESDYEIPEQKKRKR